MAQHVMRFALLRLFGVVTSLSYLAVAAAQTPTHNDVVYATATADNGTPFPLGMDVWESPAATEKAPLVVWIHGGAWLGGTYNSPPPGLQAFLNAGFAVASVQYRLSSTSIFPAQIHDVKGAVRFLRSHSDDYGIDASRVAAFGESAGGHLAALLATSGDVVELEGTIGGNLEFSSRLQGAIDFFGPTDLLNMNADVTTPPGSVINHDAPNSPESLLIGFGGAGQGIGVLRANMTNPAAPFPAKAALVTSVNPITHVTADDPTMFIAHGDLDNLVPRKQSVRLADALAAAEIEHEYRVVVGAGHGFGNQSATVTAEAIAFLTHAFDRVAGDFNGDLRVDDEDYFVWKQDFGTNRAAADANGNGLVDAGDYTIWRDHFEITSQESLAATSALPEPSVGAMLITWIILVRPCRGR